MIDKKILEQIETNKLKDLLESIKYELRQRQNNGIVRKELKKNRIFLNYRKFSNRDLFNEEIYKINSENLLSLRDLNVEINDRAKYLDCLIKQDWSYLFSDSSEDKSQDYYVYFHIDSTIKRPIILNQFMATGQVFYVGKGREQRAWNLKRNEGHGKKLQHLKKNGITDEEIVYIYKSGLSEKQARELESKLIYFFGTIFEQDRKGCLVNLRTEPKPRFKQPMEAFLSNKQLHKLKEEKTKKNIEIFSIEEREEIKF